MKPFPKVALLLLFSSIAVGQVRIITNSLPSGTVDAQYSATVATSGGEVPFIWTVSAGSLPAGLTLTPSANTRSATVSGTPTTASTCDFTISVEGHGRHVSSVSYSVTLQPQTGSNVVNLNWSPPSGDVVGYNVYRGNVHGGPYTQINASLVASTLYADSTVASGMTYYYVTTSVNNQGEQSGYSNEAEATVPSN